MTHKQLAVILMIYHTPEIVILILEMDHQIVVLCPHLIRKSSIKLLSWTHPPLVALILVLKWFILLQQFEKAIIPELTSEGHNVHDILIKHLVILVRKS